MTTPPVTFDLDVERRLVAGMLTSPDVLALCAVLESCDVTDMRLVLVFNAIRNLQALGIDVGEISAHAHLRATDEQKGTNYAGHCSEAFISDVVRSAKPYDLDRPAGSREVFADLEWARGLSKLRRTSHVREGEEYRDFVLGGGEYDLDAARTGRKTMALQRAEFFADGHRRPRRSGE